jgi:hypothetical protein
MNKRAIYAMFAGYTLVFNAQAFAVEENEDVAIQDLTPKCFQTTVTSGLYRIIYSQAP